MRTFPKTVYIVAFVNVETRESLAIYNSEDSVKAQKVFEEHASQATNVRLLMVNDISDLCPARLV